MARDYVGYENAEYVRGILHDSITKCSCELNTWCHQCGETDRVSRSGCHTYCKVCGSISEGCGD